MATKKNSAKRSRPGAKKLSALGAAILLVLAFLAVTFGAPLSAATGMSIPTWGELFAGDAAPEPVSPTAKPGSASGTESGSDGELTVHFIDVEQADCILVMQGGETLLIDAGDTDNFDEISSYLDGLGVKRLDTVIATHPHADHIGSMAAVVEGYEIGTFLMPEVPERLTPTTKTYERMMEAVAAEGCEAVYAVPFDTFTVGEATVTILGPARDDYGDYNEMSVVCRLEYGGASFLFTGDAEATSEADILAGVAAVKSTVLKLGHHGSDTSTCRAWWDAVDPEYAVIMVGEGNKYDHPSGETLDLLAERGVTPYRTDLDGTVVFTVRGGEIIVTTER